MLLPPNLSLRESSVLRQFVIVALLVSSVARAAPRTWDGGGGALVTDWSAAANWTSNIPPVANDELVFPSVGLSVNKSTNNSFPAGTDFDALTFTASGYSVGGNSLDLTNTGMPASLLLDYNSGTTTLNVGIVLRTNNHLFQIGDANKPTLDMNGAINLNGLALTVDAVGSMIADGIISNSTANPALVKSGAGSLTLNGTNTFTGSTSVQAGSLVVNKSQASSSISVASGASLTGGGSVNALTCNGFISPGVGSTRDDLGVGNLTISGATATASFQLSGSSAGTDYDQIDASGSVSLTSSPALEVTLGTGFTPAAGTEFTLINKTSAGAILGTFSGISEGSVRLVGPVLLRFSYVGGDGNDFTATVGADRTWDGGGANNLWTTAANWVGDVAPKAGDNLIFPPAVPSDSLATINNFTDNTIFGQITFTGSGYSVTANSPGFNDVFLSAGGLRDQSSSAGTNTFGIGITCGAPVSISCLNTGSLTVTGFVNNNGHALTLRSESTSSPLLTLSGDLSGTGKVIKDGQDPVRFSGSVSNSYSGGTEVLAGSLQLAKSSNAIPSGTLTVGATAAAAVVLEANNQMVDSVVVNLGGQGLLLGAFTDTIATLGLTAGSTVNMSGGALTINTAINASGAGTSTWTGSLSGPASGNTASWNISSGHVLTGQRIDKSIIKSGPGELRFTAGPTGLTDSSSIGVPEGTLVLNGSAPRTTVLASGSGVFTSSGSVREVFASSGIIRPGNPLGILTITSAPILQSGSRLEIDIGGTTPGTGHDQISTTFADSASTISGCDLDLSLIGGFVPAIGQQFRIIDNTAPSHVFVAGRFQGLPDGQQFSVGPALMEISYFGGTGNDVVLTCVDLPGQSLRVWDGEAGDGQWSNPVNWLFDELPQFGENLEFPIPISGNLVTTNDLSNATFGRITVSGGQNSPTVVFSGNQITLNDGLESAATFVGTVQWDIPIRLGNAADIRNSGGTPLDVNGAINLNGNTLTIDGPSAFSQLALTVGGAITGSGGVRKISNGIARLDGAVSNTFTGMTTVEAGLLVLGKTAGAIAVPGPLGVGGGLATASVSVVQSNQVGDASPVTVGTLGSLSLGTDTVANLVMSGGTVSATGLIISGGIEASSGTSSISGTLTLGGLGVFPHEIEIADGAVLNAQALSQVSIGRVVEKSGNGTLVLASNPSTVNLLRIVSGSVRVDSSSPALPVELAGATAVLAGNGGVGNVTSTSGGGTLSPGNSAGDFGTGNLSLSPAQTLVMEIGGTNPGTTYDQVIANGSVNLGGAALVWSMTGGFQAVEGQQFVLISNDGTDPISGTFAGIPEGHEEVIYGGMKLRFSYTGGDGNDFVASIPEVEPTNVTRVWAGEFSVPDAFWSTPANWVGGVAPQPGDNLLFPDTAPRHVAVNDFAAGTTFHQITISGDTGAGYSLQGNAIRLSGGFNYHRTGIPSECRIPMTLTAPSQFTLSGDSGLSFTALATIDLNGFPLSIQNSLEVGPSSSDALQFFGLISGAAGIEHDGTGALSFGFGSTQNTYSGQTVIKGGTFLGRVPGSVTVGGGSGAARISPNTSSSDSIPDSATLTVLAGGTYQDGAIGTEKIGNLVLEGGQITTTSPTDRLDIGGNIIVTGTGESLVAGNIGLAGPAGNMHELNVDGGASVRFTHAISSTISGTSLDKSGPGLVIFTGSNTLAGIRINEGIASFETVLGGGSSTNVPIILNGGTLRGNSAVGNVTSATGGGSITPGLGLGILNTKDVALNAASTVILEIANSTPGSGRDQINVAGTVNLGGSSLNVILDPAYLPGIGTPMVIIQNDGTDPVVGNFVGLPEGGTMSVGDIAFTVSYSGGTGNDVTLTPSMEASGITRVWSGLGANANWTTPENWVGEMAPGLGDSLEFPAGAFRRNNQNNFPAGMAFGSIRFTGNDTYTISGNALFLLDGIEATSSATTFQTISGLGLTLGQSATLQADANARISVINGSISLNGQELILQSANPTLGVEISNSPISGSGSVVVRGPGKSRVFGPNPYSGSAIVESGTLEVGTFNGFAPAISGNITVGATLEPAVLLQGTSNALSSTGTVVIGPGGQWNAEPGAIAQTVASLNLIGGLVSHGSMSLSVGSLTMLAGQINGSAFTTITGDVEVSGSADASISSPLFLSTATGTSVDFDIGEGSSLTLSGNVSGNSNGTFLRKIGSGRTTLSGANSTIERIDLENGIARFDGQAPATTVLLKGGTIDGTGRAGNLTSQAAGGTVNPGANTTTENLAGTLATGNISWNAATTLRVGILGTGPSLTHDQIRATGAVALGSSSLVLDTDSTFAPADGHVIPFLDNDGSDAIGQTFAGLPEGAIITAPNGSFTISYSGGDGNDVTLTWSADTPPSPPALSNLVITPAGAGTPAGFAATVSGGPPNGSLLLKGSPDLAGAISTWETIAVIPLDGSGSATIDLDAPPSSMGAPRYFFSLMVP